MTRRHRLSGRSSRVPLRLPVIAVTSRGFISIAVVRDGRRDERHLERGDERLGLAVDGVRELDVVGEPARLARRRRS